MLSILVMQSCNSQAYLDKNTVKTIVNNNEFTFVAQRAIPTNYDVINIMNSIPNSTSSRMLNLDAGYDVVIKNKELTATLPYFGRSFSGTQNPNDAGLRFVSKDYTITKKEGKKGKIILTISPNDVSKVNALHFEIHENGRAYLSVDSQDRQPISFDGYLEINEKAKK